MNKVSDNGTQVVYRQGNRFGLLFAILIPAGIASKIWLGTDWLPVLVVTFMGVIMLFVAGMSEQLVFDTLTRTITCTESFFGWNLRSEMIPFDRVTGLLVGRHFERENKRRGQVREAGFQLTIDWKGDWGGGGMMLGASYDEDAVRREAEELARKIGTQVVSPGAQR